ncbi:SH3 domain-containing protein [Archangium violaceum]|uniref:SH3 domain-containing protein n=1 Tax=Archangium violaceum TaxID=83451 RepID=UPI00193BF397|nr:SH3 domain-containing protein [Archangium violaceum]QRK11609.1 SH3 domain-containing protein [Archangium violaceum]
MKKRSPQHHFRAWAVCVVALSSAMGWAQDAARVYIQGSEVNLRGSPATSAEVVKKVPIGTECQCLEELAKGWVRIKCGDAEGFTLKTLVGADKPSLDKLLAQAQDATVRTKVRLDAAARAATLDPQNEQAPDLLAELFFELNFEQLAKDKVKGGLHEAIVVTRRWDHSQNRQRSREESLIWELEKIEYDWHQFRLRGGDFVSAMYRNGSLVVYTGYISPKAGDEEFNVIIESRSSSSVADALKLALQEDARPADASETKYTVIEEEYPGMPVLSPESFRLYRSLPALWYLLQGEKGARYVQSSCDIITGIQLRVDIHRRASLRFGDINSSGESPPKFMRVVDVSKSDSSYHFQLRDRREYQESLTLTWPTDESNVSQWKTEPSSTEDGYYAIARARNIKIKDFGCSAEQ